MAVLGIAEILGYRALLRRLVNPRFGITSLYETNRPRSLVWAVVIGNVLTWLTPFLFNEADSSAFLIAYPIMAFHLNVGIGATNGTLGFMLWEYVLIPVYRRIYQKYTALTLLVIAIIGFPILLLIVFGLLTGVTELMIHFRH
jgi:hypothetical protein